MDFVMSPADLEKIAGAAARIDTNPVKIVGRAFGLGDAEMQAGVPTWAWALLAVGAGAIAGAVYYPEIRKRFG